MEEWEEVLPSPPMLSDSLSSRTNLTGSGALSLDLNSSSGIFWSGRGCLFCLRGRTVLYGNSSEESRLLEHGLCCFGFGFGSMHVPWIRLCARVVQWFALRGCMYA